MINTLILRRSNMKRSKKCCFYTIYAALLLWCSPWSWSVLQEAPTASGKGPPPPANKGISFLYMWSNSGGGDWHPACLCHRDTHRCENTQFWRGWQAGHSVQSEDRDLLCPFQIRYGCLSLIGCLASLSTFCGSYFEQLFWFYFCSVRNRFYCEETQAFMSISSFHVKVSSVVWGK